MVRSKDSGLTVGELRKRLVEWPDEARITFGCTIEGDPLLYVRCKDRSGSKPLSLLHIELIEEGVNNGER